MIILNLFPKASSDFTSKCEICVKEKHVRKYFPSIIRNSKPLELIHIDVCGSNRIPTRDGIRYFVTFIDDHSRYSYIYRLKSEDEVLNWFMVYKIEVENQLEKKNKILRSHYGGIHLKQND